MWGHKQQLVCLKIPVNQTWMIGECKSLLSYNTIAYPLFYVAAMMALVHSGGRSRVPA
jgi:hypothetical protein